MTNTIRELEDGLFNMIMSMLKLYQDQGLTMTDAASKVKETLEKYSNAMNEIR